MLWIKDDIAQNNFCKILKISALVIQYGGGSVMKHIFFSYKHDVNFMKFYKRG